MCEKCPNNSNTVERKNRDAKVGVATSSNKARTCQSLKLDKSYCAKHIAAEKGCSISYRSRSSHSRAEAAEVRRKQRRMQGERDKDAVQGPPDKSCHFKSTPITCIKSSYMNHMKFTYRYSILHRKRKICCRCV